jgi:hypothetical protein
MDQRILMLLVPDTRGTEEMYKTQRFLLREVRYCYVLDMSESGHNTAALRRKEHRWSKGVIVADLEY